jgi:DNA-binding XRE family transcriptional regulator
VPASPRVAAWEKTFARLKRELSAAGRELPAVAREVGEVEYGLARLEAAIRRAGESSAKAVFAPEELLLAGVKLDRMRQTLTVRFASGARHELPLRGLRLPSAARSARLDELRHGVVLTLANGAQVAIASDLVLHRCDPDYRAAHATEQRTPPDFGPRIRSLRRASGKTARAVAAAAGMAPSNYARLEASKHQPRVETLLAVASALEVSLEELVRI